MRPPDAALQFKISAAAFGWTIALLGVLQCVDVATAVGQKLDRAINPLAVTRIDDLAATRDHPLFSRNRQPYRPVEVLAVPTVPLPPIPNFFLVGVVLGDSTRLVILMDPAQKTQVRREGETFDGWKLMRVEPQQALIQNGSTEFRLLLPMANLPSKRAQPANSIRGNQVKGD